MTPKEEDVTKEKCSLVFLSQKDEAAQNLHLAIKQAKLAGVDVAGLFLEVREEVMLAWVRMFGLVLGILYIFICPLLIPLYKIYCFRAHMDYNLAEWFYYWPCIVGLVSIIAFGFNLVDPRTLRKITGKPEALISKLMKEENDNAI